MNALKCRIAKRNRDTHPKSWEALYESIVICKIRKKYSVNQELAILRQRDSKPEEFSVYNAFVEECKAQAKAELAD